MVNYACSFSQSEPKKHLEWIIIEPLFFFFPTKEPGPGAFLSNELAPTSQKI